MDKMTQETHKFQELPLFNSNQTSTTTTTIIS